tara:strand:+ start:131237 stop:131821 length:585 start_codon:yes stop_codon:yes gene_type:complete
MKAFIYLGFVLLFLSCGKSEKVEDQVIEKSEFSTPKKHSEAAVVLKKNRNSLEDWKEYEALNDFIQKFQSISPNGSLSNSKELNSIVKNLNDSIKPAFLESPAFNARVNLLYNETLRLYDMSSISSIKAEEVNLQVGKMLHAFSSLNSKINIIILQQNLEKEVEDTKLRKSVYIDSIPNKRPETLEKDAPKDKN